ncbi:Protein transport protein Sec61 subunit beta [Mortierella claussenii]|nr:Protein transport protein Sec61 subunit beta [Mortierella claussenii]
MLAKHRKDRQGSSDGTHHLISAFDLSSHKSDSAASPNPAGASPRAAAIRRRTTNSKSAQTSRAPGPSTSGMMRIYTDDSPGLRVDPVVVLVLSLAFIASVFALHIYGKLTRA